MEFCGCIWTLAVVYFVETTRELHVDSVRVFVVEVDCVWVFFFLLGTIESLFLSFDRQFIKSIVKLTKVLCYFGNLVTLVETPNPKPDKPGLFNDSST